MAKVVSDEELRKQYSDLFTIAEERNGAALLLEKLPTQFSSQDISEAGPEQRTWELLGMRYLHCNPPRPHEALAIFWSLYQHMLSSTKRGHVHKGMPLVWISDCYALLGCLVHAKRYLQLTLCEDAIRGRGIIQPGTTGSYFRLVWGGMPDYEFRRYAMQYWELAQKHPELAKFPEALLQQLDDDWLTVAPAAVEAFVYRANERYINFLLHQLGAGGGKQLEFLADYLMSCMPGCRTKRRMRSGSTDYDVVCSMEGLELDFRSELGRYFVCECKDWSAAADFTTMAKFCRVLDSFKAKFGILFSKNGISGENRTTDAAREQLKVFHDRGIVVVVLNLSDLQTVAAGKNLISLLRSRYEAVRLDIPHTADGKISQKPIRSRSKTKSRKQSKA